MTVERQQQDGKPERKVYAITEAWMKTARADHPDAPYELLTLSYGRHEAEALVRWCDESLTALSSPEPVKPTEGENV